MALPHWYIELYLSFIPALHRYDGKHGKHIAHTHTIECKYVRIGIDKVVSGSELERYPQTYPVYYLSINSCAKQYVSQFISKYIIFFLFNQ